MFRPGLLNATIIRTTFSNHAVIVATAINGDSYLNVLPVASRIPALGHSSCALHRTHIHDPSASKSHNSAVFHHIGASSACRRHMLCASGEGCNCCLQEQRFLRRNHYLRSNNLLRIGWGPRGTAMSPAKRRREEDCPWWARSRSPARQFEDALGISKR